MCRFDAGGFGIGGVGAGQVQHELQLPPPIQEAAHVSTELLLPAKQKDEFVAEQLALDCLQDIRSEPVHAVLQSIGKEQHAVQRPPKESGTKATEKVFTSVPAVHKIGLAEV